MTKRLTFFLFLVALLFHSCHQPKSNFELVLPSSDAKVHLYFNLNDGEPYYLVYFNSEIVMDWSLLGFTSRDGVKLSEGLQVVKTESRSGQSNDEISVNPAFPFPDNYNELIVFLEKKSPVSEQVAIIFRAYDKGIAFCYLFPENEKSDEVFLLSEETQFDLYGVDSIWQVEGLDHPLEEKSKIQENKNNELLDLPVDFKCSNGLPVTISECKTIGYPSMKLHRRTPGKPEFEFQPSDHRSSEKWIIERGVNTPWRIICFTKI
jgi:alpha-glucosidase